MNKYDHAKFIIERFDHYYDSVNNKGAFYMGLNTFIFGGICVGYLTTYKELNISIIHWILCSLLLVSNVVSVYFTVAAIMPFMKDNPENPDNTSLIYFGGISKHTFAHFKEKFDNAQDQEMLDDLVQQTHCLASGLTTKYKNLKRASYFIITQFVIMLPLILLIVQNLKK